MRVAIGTGRTHQIRVHLSEAGHPVVGDAVYGGTRRKAPASWAVARPLLHAARLSFVHPATGQSMTFDAPLPEDFASVMARLEPVTT